MAVIEEKPKRVRTPFDPNTMGFGKHVYEHIDPRAIDVEALTSPPGGIRTRDFTVAFNKKNPETNITIDLLSRRGCVFETNAPGLEGVWVVLKMPALRNAVMLVVCCRKEDYDLETEDLKALAKEVSVVDLGIVPDRFSNLYRDSVITKHVEGGQAGREVRERLTKLK